MGRERDQYADASGQGGVDQGLGPPWDQRGLLQGQHRLPHVVVHGHLCLQTPQETRSPPFTLPVLVKASPSKAHGSENQPHQSVKRHTALAGFPWQQPRRADTFSRRRATFWIKLRRQRLQGGRWSTWPPADRERRRRTEEGPGHRSTVRPSTLQPRQRRPSSPQMH